MQKCTPRHWALGASPEVSLRSPFCPSRCPRGGPVVPPGVPRGPPRPSRPRPVPPESPVSLRRPSEAMFCPSEVSLQQFASIGRCPQLCPPERELVPCRGPSRSASVPQITVPYIGATGSPCTPLYTCVPLQVRSASMLYASVQQHKNVSCTSNLLSHGHIQLPFTCCFISANSTIK